MKSKSQINIFWFRRDLRLEDNTALNEALKSKFPVLPLFIFDSEILSELPKNDPRVQFIHSTLSNTNTQLKKYDSGIQIEHGSPEKIWEKLIKNHNIHSVYTNTDYEPYARVRDGAIADKLKEKGIHFLRFKDQVIFETNEIVKADGLPYTVFTPYKNKWIQHYEYQPYTPEKILSNFVNPGSSFPSLSDLGFKKSNILVKDFKFDQIDQYDELRNFPSKDATSYLSPHLRLGSISIRELVPKFYHNSVFLSELIWREFFMQILYHFPRVQTNNFRSKYDGIKWRNNPIEFQKWCDGNTGYPMVDAGMRQLNQTGYMHNRVRMVVASFLCKHLLIDWKWGEAYFAKKLLDYDLSANNGNWQWAAGTGCDAAPYFRVFNPSEQLKKFDKDLNYVRKWVPELDEISYVPMVDHKMARERALTAYKQGIERMS